MFERTSEVPVEAPEALDVVPQQFRVKRYVQGKYHCSEGTNRDIVKTLPSWPIQDGRPSPTLLA